MSGVDFAHDRFLVTGRGGFLGSFVCGQLCERGVSANHVIIPRFRQYDLTQQADVQRLFAETRPDVVIHLAAEVGGIGANRDNLLRSRSPCVKRWTVGRSTRSARDNWHYDPEKRRSQGDPAFIVSFPFPYAMSSPIEIAGKDVSCLRQRP